MKNINLKLRIKTLTFSFLLSFLCFLLFACSSSTSSQTGSLSGTVLLEGQTDHSGIVIGIYEFAELDPDIVDANTKWPHIGVIINQHTEFDHRFGTLIKTGETDASGYFEISDISTGVYNVVAIKDGFGFRYIYEISISEGNNEISNAKLSILNSQLEKDKQELNNNSKLKIKNSPLDSYNKHAKADFILYPETIITSDITEETTFESYHHYIIDQDIIVDDELTIEPGAVIRLNGGKEITNHGAFNAVGEYENFIWLTKNDGFSQDLNTIDPDSNYIWDRVTLEPYSLAQVQWCKFDWANIGLLNYVNGFEISDCIFRDSQCGFKAESVDSTFCSNLLCEGIDNEQEGGIYFLNVGDGVIEKNIVIDCENGIKIKDQSSPVVENNYISQNIIGLNIKWFKGIINNNIFNENSKDILFTGCPDYQGLIKISLNEFYSDYAINQLISFNDSYHIFPQIEISENNFFCSDIYLGYYSFYVQYYGINFINNYYLNTSGEEEILAKIINYTEDNYDYLTYIPWNVSLIESAGIQ